MQLLFRALKNWALQVHVAKDNTIVGDVEACNEARNQEFFYALNQLWSNAKLTSKVYFPQFTKPYKYYRKPLKTVLEFSLSYFLR